MVLSVCDLRQDLVYTHKNIRVIYLAWVSFVASVQ